MMRDSAVRWVRLALRVAVAFGVAFTGAQAAGGKGMATWLPALIAAGSTLEAGLSLSPAQPVETIVTNTPANPVPTKEEKL